MMHEPTSAKGKVAPMRLYLAGPMTGKPRWNFDVFAEWTLTLRDLGFEVWSPAERDLDKGFDPNSDGSTFDLKAALEEDIQAVIDCDAVALLPGWEDSPGVLMECVVADAYGITWAPVEFLIEHRTQIPPRPKLRRVAGSTVALFLLASTLTLVHLQPIAEGLSA